VKTDKTIIQEFDDLFGQTVFDEEWNDLDAQEKVKSFLLSKVREAREDYEKEIEKEIGEMKQQDEMQEPRLFQSNPTIKLYHEWGGYSSVPFYCSLCGMSEVDIQDNKIKEGYHCNCSVWTNSCGGEWIRWFKGVKKARKIAERFYPNVYNQALQDVLDLLKKEKWGLLLL